MIKGLNVKKTISAKQLMYSAALFIIASNLLTRSLYQFTKNQTWFAVLLGTAIGIVLISIYGRLVKSHPGRSLIEINEAVFGVIGGKVVSALYVFFFLTLTVLNTWDLGNFVKAFVLPATPMNLIYAFFSIICVYAVKKGADKMTRYGALILFVYLALLLFNSALLITKFHPENFLPVFTVPLKNQLLSANLVAMLPLGEIFVFLMMSQFMEKSAAAGKALKRGMLIGAAAILFIVVRDIAVMGNFTMVTSSPTFTTIRLIDVGDILTRLEIINAVFQMILLFFKTSILLYATVAGVGKLFKIEQYEIFTLIIGALVVVCVNFFLQSTFEHMKWFYAAAPYSTFFLFVLPLVTLFTSEIKKKACKQKAVDLPQQP